MKNLARVLAFLWGFLGVLAGIINIVDFIFGVHTLLPFVMGIFALVGGYYSICFALPTELEKDR